MDFSQFQNLPLELQKQILTQYPETLQKAPLIASGYKELVGSEYYKEICQKSITINELAHYLNNVNPIGVTPRSSIFINSEYADIYLFNPNLTFSIIDPSTIDGGIPVIIGTEIKVGYDIFRYHLYYISPTEIAFQGTSQGEHIITFEDAYYRLLSNFQNNHIILDIGAIYQILLLRLSCIEHDPNYVKTLVLGELDYYYKTLSPEKLYLYLLTNSILLNLSVEIPLSGTYDVTVFNLPQRNQELYQMIRERISLPLL